MSMKSLAEKLARDAARRKAAPPMATDEYIASNIDRLDAIEDARGVSCLTNGEEMQRAALLEIQRRRASDLTPEEIAAVRDLLLSLDGEPRAMRSALAKILAAHGVTP